MTKHEIYNCLDNIKRTYSIFPIDEENCRNEYSDKIKRIESIFELKNSIDFTYFFALAEMFADEDKVETIKENLLAEYAISKTTVNQPAWDDYVFLITALEDNPVFFSMVYNWIVLNEGLINKQMFDLEDGWKLRNVAGTGNTQYAEQEIKDIGILFFDLNENHKYIRIGLKFNESLKDKKFVVIQNVSFRSDRNEPIKKLLLTFRNEDKIYSEKLKLSSSIDPSKGVRFIGNPKIEFLNE